jgi:RNA polymerase sigma-70 factor (ECF subfamily)
MGLLTSLFAANDEQLMWRVKLDDDASAFARLVERWQQPIQRLCFRMTGDVHRAEDLTQTAFTRVFTRRAEWEPTGKFSTFLWRVALNLCHDDLRRQQRRGEFSLDALLELDSAEERGELVRRALAGLPAHYREVVVLRHYEGLKFREIGEVLGIPEGTVKSRMAEALGQLNRLLKHVNEDEICNRKTQTPEVQVL